VDTLPLPPRPSLEQYRKLAKDLVAAARSNDDNAVRAWASDWLESLVEHLGVKPTPFVQSSIDRAIAHIEARVRDKSTRGGSDTGFVLADAQYLIAEAHGFEHWADFAQHLETLAVWGRKGDAFESAADAVVDGDLATLETLIREHPELVRARSERVHTATLLHYVAANGVEDFRQKTPPNAVAVARCLLEAGAEVDALANTYSTSSYETTLNLLVSSAHPAGAGLQSALVDTLLDFGAAINGLADDESPMMTALDFGYPDAAETLARRGARVDNVVTAAALGRLDLVQRFVIGRNQIAPGVPLLAPPWLRQPLPAQAKAHIEYAFVWACKFARTDVAGWLLTMDPDPAAIDGYAMTALHWAAANGMTATIGELLRRPAPLEAENTWGGTVLNSTLHFAVYQPVAGVNYVAVIDALLSAGADVSVVSYPTGIEPLDKVLRKHGARAG
jgi:ankyrin repeat protein